MTSALKPTIEENIERASNTLDKINFWISNCDTKVSFSLAFTGILLGGLFTSSIITGSLSKLVKKLISFNSVHWNINLIEVTTGLLLILFFAFYITTTMYLFKALKGSIDTSVYKQPGLTTNNSRIFFGSIAKKSFLSFKGKVVSSSKNQILNDYLSQIYINSKICQRKFELYNKGIKWLLGSSILFILINIFFLFL